MRATSETVENNKVKLSIIVDEADIETALTSVVKTLGHQVRIPGFRPGKVPRKVLEARMGGAGALRAEALRESLPDFYAEAVITTEIDPISLGPVWRAIRWSTLGDYARSKRSRFITLLQAATKSRTNAAPESSQA